jgi:hypothetical protein
MAFSVMAVVAAPSASAARIQPGGSWTVVDLPTNSCDDILFGTGHTWTGGGGTGGNDSGTYTGGRLAITMTWKTGYYSTLHVVFRGTWSAAQHAYVGTFTYTGGPGPGELVPGQQC